MASTLTSSNRSSVRIADMKDSRDMEYLFTVLDNYKADGMGESLPYTSEERKLLTRKFKEYPKIYIFLAFYNGQIAGGTVCFQTFSTFTTGDVINIHDICVLKEFRGKGLGRDLMNAVIKKAEDTGCHKVTLEVREDNEVAQNLYSSLGFGEANPPMKFWSKFLI